MAKPPRSGYGNAGSGYRGSSAPIQQYAFTSTPALNTNLSWQQYGTYRTNGSPVTQGYDQNANFRGVRPNVHSPTNVGYIHPMGVSQSGSRDDSAIMPVRAGGSSRHSSYLQSPNSPTFAPGSSSKAAPDRYRRTTTQHARSQSFTPSSMGSGQTQPGSEVRPTSLYGSLPNGSLEDVKNLGRSNRQPAPEEVIKLRRSQENLSSSSSTLQPISNNRPHSRNGSTESVNSSRSSHSRPSSVSFCPL